MGSLVRQTFAILALAFIPAIGQALYERNRISWNEDAIAPDEATVEQVKEWGEAVLWVDARPDDEYEKQHVPGAIPLNEDRWNELLPGVLSVWSPAKKTVVYCSTQTCALSHHVAKRLREEAGLKEIYVLHGGWEKWQEANK